MHGKVDPLKLAALGYALEQEAARTFIVCPVILFLFGANEDSNGRTHPRETPVGNPGHAVAVPHLRSHLENPRPGLRIDPGMICEAAGNCRLGQFQGLGDLLLVHLLHLKIVKKRNTQIKTNQCKQ